MVGSSIIKQLIYYCILGYFKMKWKDNEHFQKILKFIFMNLFIWHIFNFWSILHMHLHIHDTFSLFFCQWVFQLFSYLGCNEHRDEDTFTSWFNFISSGYIFRVGISGSFGSFFFFNYYDPPSVFHNVCTNLHSYQ